jgi:membrane protein YqaA with SNARE-associated domain
MVALGAHRARLTRRSSISIFGFFSPGGHVLPAMVDSSQVCVVPFGIDALVVVLAATYGEIFWIFPPIVTAVSLAGAALTYWIGRTAGDAGLPRFVAPHHIERIKARLDRTGSGLVAVAAVMPPPFPLTPVLLTCGALDFDRRRFLLVFGMMRLIRFSAEGLLARHYGSQVLEMLQWDWLQTAVTAVALVGSAAAIVMGAVLWSRMRPQPA